METHSFFYYIQQLLQSINIAGLGDAAFRAAAVLLCLTVHETCHGLAALALGDPTAKSMNRLSLNPLRHLDLLGTVMMFAAGFGWAKPVPVDPRYFKDPKKGMAITALAGPVSNFALAFGALALFSVLSPLLPVTAWTNRVLLFLLDLSVLSVGLGVFNLLPIPPLDGSKVLAAFLPDSAYYRLMRYERYGMVVLLALSFLNVGSVSISNAIYAVWSAMAGLFR